MSETEGEKRGGVLSRAHRPEIHQELQLRSQVEPTGSCEATAGRT